MNEEETVEVLEGADLCLCCLEPVRPGASLCQHCGAPQDFLATALPFLKILAEGFAYHRAIQRPRSWWSVAGIWLIFGQLTISSGLMLWSGLSMVHRDPDPGLMLYLLPPLAFGLLGVTGVITCTVNYSAYRRALRDTD